MGLTVAPESACASFSNCSKDSMEVSQACGRSRASVASCRYSSTCKGEVFSHWLKAPRSRAVKPARLATNQSAASSAISARMRPDVEFIVSPQSFHPAPAMRQAPTQMFLDHLSRDPEPLCDLLVAQVVPV